VSDALELIPSPEPARWDALVESAEGATVFHTAAWARTWAAEWPGATWQVIARNDGAKLAAGLAFVARTGAGGRRIFSMPDGTYGGPLVGPGSADPAANRRRLLEEYGRLVSARGVLASQLTWLAPPGAPSARAALAGTEAGMPGGLETQESFTQVVALGPGFDPTLAHLPHGVRSRVRQAEESGLTLRTAADPAAVRAYHELVVRNARRHGSRPRPLSLYLRVLEILVPLGLARFDLVEHQGEVIGGSLHLLHGGRAVNWLTVADDGKRQLRPNHFVIARWLRERSAAGDREYDLGSSPAGAQGLIDFKSSWGSSRRAVLVLRRRSLLDRLLRR
jgi:CelD/BcsL family acetyltransferase involved in cellulose biosynthesis